MLAAVVHWCILVAIVPVILPVYGAQMTDSAIVSGGAPRAEVFTALNEVGAAAGPVAAMYESKTGKGRMCVVGSTHIFDDKWLDKEDVSRSQRVWSSLQLLQAHMQIYNIQE